MPEEEALMSLTIDLPLELEKRLLHEASRRGLDASELVRRLIEPQLATTNQWAPLEGHHSPEEWKAQFRAWLDSHDATKPPLPEEAFERASFYGERG
jgi:hypothetical protein